MPRRNRIPKTVAHRLILTMEALGLRPVDVQNLTGFSSSKLSNYMSGRYVPPARDAGPRLCRALGINAAWLYEGNIDLLAHYVAVKIEKLLDEGWTAPVPHTGIGRRRMKNRTKH